MRYVVPLVVFVGLSFLAGGLGSLASIGQVDGWYETLVRPSWTPPNWVFAPVWNTLFLLMGTAMALVWVRGGMGRIWIAWLFVSHLIVNTLWSVAFFALHELLLSLIIMVILWVMIVVLMRVFARRVILAAWLMVPYLLWVSYAATLNVGYLVLN